MKKHIVIIILLICIIIIQVIILSKIKLMQIASYDLLTQINMQMESISTKVNNLSLK